MNFSQSFPRHLYIAVTLNKFIQRSFSKAAKNASKVKLPKDSDKNMKRRSRKGSYVIYD